MSRTWVHHTPCSLIKADHHASHRTCSKDDPRPKRGQAGGSRGQIPSELRARASHSSYASNYLALATNLARCQIRTIKQDSERCGKATDQLAPSPYSFVFYHAVSGASLHAVWLLPPPGFSYTCESSRRPRRRTC